MVTTSRLHVLRHAKSSWDDASLRDDERPLAPRGHRATDALRRHFEAIGLQVDLVLCSPARRTRETWDGVRAGLRVEPEVRIEPAIYEASANRLLSLVRSVDPDVTSLLLVGHNPGVEELTAGLAGEGHPRLADGFPTGGFASLTLVTPWAELGWGGAGLDDVVRPRELPGG